MQATQGKPEADQVADWNAKQIKKYIIYDAIKNVFAYH